MAWDTTDSMDKDMSAVSFRAVIRYKGTDYITPLYEIEDEKTFKETLSIRLGQPCNRMSVRALFHIRRMEKQVHKLAPELSDDLLAYFRHPINYETELVRYRCVQRVINTMKALYYTCLNKHEDTSDLELIFQIFECSLQYYDARKKSEESEWSFADELSEIPDIATHKNEVIEHALKDLSPINQLCDVYSAFYLKNKAILDKNEHRFRVKKEKPNERYCVHYWQNPTFREELRKLFWDYCRQLPKNELHHMLLKRDTASLIKYVLDCLDKQLSESLGQSSPTICTSEATVIWSTGHLETAEYLHLYSDLIQRKKFRRCPICGALFAVPEKYGKQKKYCGKHSPHQIQYFMSFVNDQEKKKSGMQSN